MLREGNVLHSLSPLLGTDWTLYTLPMDHGDPVPAAHHGTGCSTRSDFRVIRIFLCRLQYHWMAVVIDFVIVLLWNEMEKRKEKAGRRH